jgi:hypothetical protein
MAGVVLVEGSAVEVLPVLVAAVRHVTAMGLVMVALGEGGNGDEKCKQEEQNRIFHGICGSAKRSP